jgi:hypothetical protein
MDAWQVHVPVLLHVRLQVFPSHTQTLESLQVRLQLPVVDSHCAVQLSVPLQVRLHGPGSLALQDSIFGPMPPHPNIESTNAKQTAENIFDAFI